MKTSKLAASHRITEQLCHECWLEILTYNKRENIMLLICIDARLQYE